MNSNDLSLTTTESLDPQEMREKLSLQENLMAHKDKALAEAKDSLGAIQKEMKAWQAQHKETHRKLLAAESSNAILKNEVREVDRYRQEARTLRERVGRLESVETVLRGCKEEVDAEVRSTSHTNLATIVVALKRDYDVLKAKRTTLLKEKSKLVDEIGYLKKELASKEKSARQFQDQLSILETDLHSAEKERRLLQTKMEMLQEAIDSPGSRVALKRILESPMPEQLANQRRIKEVVDIGASPLLVPKHTEVSATAGVRKDPLQVGTKRPRPALSERENFIVMPISKTGKLEARPPVSKNSSNLLKKELRFVPRKNLAQKSALATSSFNKW